MLAAYGPVPGLIPLPLDHAAVYGLFLNLERVRMDTAIAVSLGLWASSSGSKLPDNWFDALARHESQIDPLRYETNVTRAHAAMMRKHGSE